MRLLFGLVIASAACIPPEIAIEGKPCPCPSEFTCDAVSLTCVRDGGGAGPGASGPGGGAAGPGTGASGGEGAGASGPGGSGGVAGSGGAGPCEGACGSENCGECPDVTMVEAADFMIDAYEVSIGDYLAFLAIPVDPATQPAVCSWNASFHPNDSVDAGPGGCSTFELVEPNRPIGCVDWCDANAYCEWRGKRLCGKRGGGTLMKVEADLNDATKSEWYAACSNDGVAAFPYGDVEDVDACNTAGGVSSGGKTSDVGYYDECVGGVVGLFDMVGNAEEWEGACDNFGETAQVHSCELRGGAFWADAADFARCESQTRSGDRGTASHDWTFRCCGDLP